MRLFYFEIIATLIFIAFFDLGCATGASSSSAAVRRNSFWAITNQLCIELVLQKHPNHTIIFSHLHDDHISIYNSLNVNTHAQLFRQAEWSRWN